MDTLLFEFDIPAITPLQTSGNPKATNQKIYMAGEIPAADLLCFIDGSCKPNPGQMAVGVYMEYKGQPVLKKTYPGGYGTNNEAEFCSLLQAVKTLKMIEEKKHEAASGKVAVISDSQLLVGAVRGDAKVKGNLKLRLDEIQEIAGSLQNPLEVFWVPREKNTAAHILSADNQIPTTV